MMTRHLGALVLLVSLLAAIPAQAAAGATCSGALMLMRVGGC